MVSLREQIEELYMKLSNSKPLPQQMASPTTFVHADASSFRELVQKLTGANDQCQEKLPITPRYNCSSDHKQTSKNESICIKKIKSCTGRNSRPNRRIAAQEKRDGIDSKLEAKHKSDAFKKSGISSVIRLPTLSDLVHSLVNSAAPASGSESQHYSTESSSGASLELASIYGEEASGCTMEDNCSSIQPTTFERKTDSELELLLLFPLHSETEDQIDRRRTISLSAA
ncbi:hypothetical protein O6H91_19G072900 [Diphasiastrum complanatum]|uniref:Uncharacterized protein n=1 Tax=Diphasiastrum complanatum TaxID=34168 RepID=A0ACC2AWJ6_DIPCM|nr:hypothetical protein O6H91_19G072900 [Diphasiastrum complanatum]